jgi:hypothetical protein
VLKFNRPGGPAWWFNARILRKRTFALGQIRVLNFLTPIFRIVDPVLPFSPLSLIAILRREATVVRTAESVGTPASLTNSDP